MSQSAAHSADAPAGGVSTMEGNPEPLCAIVTPMGMLGYGFDEQLLTRKLDELVGGASPFNVAVIMDSGSTDSGPSKLALGTMTCPEESYRRDLTKLVRATINHKVPVLISSVGGDGSNDHVDLFVKMVQEIAASLNCPRKLNVLALYSEVSKDVVEQKLLAGDITGCGDEVPQLTIEEINSTPRILAQMGHEPILEAILCNPDFDILIAGRAYDPAIFVAFCAMSQAGSSPPQESLNNTLLGGFYHMGKIMECGGLCATPKSAGAVALVYKDGTFDISPQDPAARCVPLSVAAHTLYEKARPDILHGPGGYLDLTRTTYEQLPDEITVRVRGADFIPSNAEGSPYTVKLEGARVIGSRSIFFGSFKDPILIGQIHEYLEGVKVRCALQHIGMEGNWKLDFHIYGAPEKRSDSANPINRTQNLQEVFVVGEILAASPTLARSVASTARVYCSHAAYKGQMATSGNFAFGIGGKTELDVGDCCEFSIYHLMNLTHGEQHGHAIHTGEEKVVDKALTVHGIFPWQRVEIPASASGSTNSTGPISRSESNVDTISARKERIVDQGKNTLPAKDFSNAKVLKDVAKVIRSKNAGPFQITFDVIFDDPVLYEVVKSSGILRQEAVAHLFRRSVDEVVWCGFFDQALAFKLTLPRTRNGELRCSGGFMENDVHGSQQYLPLMELPLSEELKRTLKAMG